ncbi:MAG: HepT-like ribonuclease domain-containing protein [Pyrobaculum sp.]
MDKEMGTNCGDVLSSLISLRNLLVHRYFQVDDQKLYNSVRGNFTCVEN